MQKRTITAKNRPSLPPVQVTAAGLEQLKKDLIDWEAKRTVAVKELATARAMGDLSENAAYTAARRKLNGVDYQVRRLKRIIPNAQVIEKPEKGIGLGSTVECLFNGKTVTYSIVGGVESDLMTGKLSQFSPVGKALMGHDEGETVEVTTPGGVSKVEVVKVS
jgi:transcription elongation factor GreA